jgi:hypothetical protein
MKSIGFDDFRFHAEVPENYTENRPIGRVDLHVYSIEEFKHRNRYFIIECKRINGTLTLNKAYINDGIRRFVGNDPKYTSYYKTNGMIGFVVRDISIENNVAGINELLSKDYRDIHVHKNVQLLLKPYIYISSHGCAEDRRVVLIHAFPNISSIIKT